MTIPSPLERQKQKVALLEKECLELQEMLKYAQAKLEGMLEMDAFKASTTGSLAPFLWNSPLQVRRSEEVGSGEATIASKTPAKKRRRLVSDQWRKILLFIKTSDGVALDLIERFASVDGIERKLVRAQMAYYEKQGFIKKNENSDKFILTDAGFEVCGFQKDGMPSAINTEGLDFKSEAAGASDKDVSDLV
jgi:hypothetical protein